MCRGITAAERLLYRADGAAASPPAAVNGGDAMIP